MGFDSAPSDVFDGLHEYITPGIPALSETFTPVGRAAHN